MDLIVVGSNLGCTVNPTPFDAGRLPRPNKCLLGGLGPEYCNGVFIMGASPASVPWSRRKRSGYNAGVVVTVQGVIEDDAAPSGLSVTNAVILRIQ